MARRFMAFSLVAGIAAAAVALAQDASAPKAAAPAVASKPSPATAAAPATKPAWIGVKQPNGERPFVGQPDNPTARVWRYRHNKDVDLHITAQGVGPDSAMVIFTEKGEDPGEFLIYDPGARGEDLIKYKGMCVWVKGDGGDGNLSLGTNWDQNNKNNSLLGKFPLSEKGWKKYFIPWDKFTPPTKGFYFINMKLEPAKPRQAWACIARLNFYVEETTEEIDPPKDKDPEGMIPAQKFVLPSVDDAAGKIPNTLAKLKAGKPVTIVATGDSITAGAQLWYKGSEGKAGARESLDYTYPAVLARKLAAHYKYAKSRNVMKWMEYVSKATSKTASGLEKDGFFIITGEKPEADGTLPFDGLQVIGVGAGGKDTKFGLDHLSDLTQFKPDLVIWYYGHNDQPPRRIKNYVEYSTKAIKELQAQGIEVILAGTTLWLGTPYYENSEAFVEPGMQMAKELGIPYVNQFAAMTSRGPRYIGDFMSDGVHLNEFGHSLLASTLAASLGVPDQHVWDQPMFKAIKAGAKINQ